MMDEEAMEEERKDAKRLQMLWGIDDRDQIAQRADLLRVGAAARRSRPDRDDDVLREAEGPMGVAVS